MHTMSYCHTIYYLYYIPIFTMFSFLYHAECERKIHDCNIVTPTVNDPSVRANGVCLDASLCSETTKSRP